MREPKLTCAFSPCPNDTFAIHQLAQNPDVEIQLHDVESLNRWAFEERFDVTKLSFHAYLLLQHRYTLLNVGAALGHGCGPLVIHRADYPVSLNARSVIAVPGEYTTAFLLLRLWNPELKHFKFLTFDKIMNAVESDRVDAGVIIHEGRFTYKKRGFTSVVDLGDWWEQETGLPIPLGCVAVKKSLGKKRIAEIEEMLANSVRAALDNPDASSDYIKQHAQELNDDVIAQHIKTYVNDFTLDLGKEGRAAVSALQEMCKRL